MCIVLTQNIKDQTKKITLTLKKIILHGLKNKLHISDNDLSMCENSCNDSIFFFSFHESLVVCHVSCVTCCVSPVTCHMSLTAKVTAMDAAPAYSLSSMHSTQPSECGRQRNLISVHADTAAGLHSNVNLSV